MNDSTGVEKLCGLDSGLDEVSNSKLKSLQNSCETKEKGTFLLLDQLPLTQTRVIIIPC